MGVLNIFIYFNVGCKAMRTNFFCIFGRIRQFCIKLGVFSYLEELFKFMSKVNYVDSNGIFFSFLRDSNRINRHKLQ